MSEDRDRLEVGEEPAEHRFVVRLGGQPAGFTAYEARPDGVREFVHTVIEPEFEGRGLASLLIGEALGSTRAAGLKVAASCPFVRAYVRKRPEEFRDLVVDPRL